MKELCNYIAGHKYRKGAWNLPHKFHLYLIYIIQDWFGVGVGVGVGAKSHAILDHMCFNQPYAGFLMLNEFNVIFNITFVIVKKNTTIEI